MRNLSVLTDFSIMARKSISCFEAGHLSSFFMEWELHWIRNKKFIRWKLIYLKTTLINQAHFYYHTCILFNVNKRVLIFCNQKSNEIETFQNIVIDFNYLKTDFLTVKKKRKIFLMKITINISKWWQMIAKNVVIEIINGKMCNYVFIMHIDLRV